MSTRPSRRRPAAGLVQAEVGIVGMAVVTLLVSLAGLWFSHELKDTTVKVRDATVGIQSSVDAYKKAMKSTATMTVLIGPGDELKSDNKKVEEADRRATASLDKAEHDTRECLTLLDTVLRLLATYETTTVTFAGCALIFALFVIIRQFRL